MPKFELKKTEIKKEDGFISYADFARTALNNTPQSGFSIDEMRKRMRILDILDKEKLGFEEMDLNNEDIKILKSSVSSMKWGVIHKDIIAFCDAVEKLGGE
ncbi:hypothetical protein A2415_04450 [candidate division WWE3 bacterium RIFOXYC1_FULL_39_7]|uniref:Uncharacterized protein n=1 Tax=candidate division WWE3 bacterium RIFOXYC1_FULL_39_7 TaxID=1802643 RepID=A0A1F4WFS8_UNCKA|nr:MAG: hypothetical protein A2415_04450 [candidate division WWE3 bacterium RIFOXYC1_FULL_39_7]